MTAYCAKVRRDVRLYVLYTLTLARNAARFAARGALRYAVLAETRGPKSRSSRARHTSNGLARLPVRLASSNRIHLRLFKRSREVEALTTHGAGRRPTKHSPETSVGVFDEFKSFTEILLAFVGSCRALFGVSLSELVTHWRFPSP